MITTEGSGKQRVFSAISIGLMVEAINKVSPLFMITLAQRRLGLESFGYAQFIIALVELTIPFMVFGYTYYGAVAFQQTRHSQQASQKLIGSILTLRLMHIAALVLMLFMAFTLIPSWNEHRIVVLAMLPLVLFSACELTFVNYGAQRMTRLSLWVGLFKILSLAGIYFLVKSPEDAIIYATLTIAAGSLVGLTSMVWVLRRVGISWPSFTQLKQTFYHGALFAPIVLLYPLLQRFDIILAEHFLGANELGLYSAPWRLALSLFPIFYVVTNTFFSESLIANDNLKLRRNTLISMFVCLSMATPVALAMAFTGDEVLAWLFDESFIGYGNLLTIFCVSILIESLVMIYSMQVLVVKRQMGRLALLFIFSITLGVSLAFILALTLGIYGIAIAALLSRLALCIGLMIVAKPHVGWPALSNWLHIVLAGFAMVMTLFLLKENWALWSKLAVAGIVYLSVLLLSSRNLWLSLFKTNKPFEL